MLDARHSPLRLILALTITVVACGSGGCVTGAATPDMDQIELGLRYAREDSAPTRSHSASVYTAAASDPLARPTVALVIPRNIVDAPPRRLGGSNLYAGRAVGVEINPTLVVVKSMSAYLDDHASVEIVPDLNAVSAEADLVLEPVVDLFEWRTNGWSQAYFAARIEARLDLTLHDHTNETEQVFQSGWVTGGTYWSSTAKGVANRVVRAVAHSTATILDEADLVARLSSP